MHKQASAAQKRRKRDCLLYPGLIQCPQYIVWLFIAGTMYARVYDHPQGPHRFF